MLSRITNCVNSLVSHKTMIAKIEDIVSIAMMLISGCLSDKKAKVTKETKRIKIRILIILGH